MMCRYDVQKEKNNKKTKNKNNKNKKTKKTSADILLYIKLTISFLIARKHTVKFRKSAALMLFLSFSEEAKT